MGKSALALKPDFISIDVSVRARDRIRLNLEVVGGEIVTSELNVLGCTELLTLVKTLRPKLKGRLDQLALPEGTGHAAMLLREALLKAQGLWDFPYKDAELCHCRAVATSKVDGAILGGCHSVDAIKRATSASTSCGTCRQDVERVLEYRLNQATKK
jgi:bacterioferritin-associated ferredoxin